MTKAEAGYSTPTLDIEPSSTKPLPSNEQIFAMVADIKRLAATEAQARSRLKAISAAYEQIVPSKPRALRHSLHDHFELRMPLGAHCRGVAFEPDHSDFYHEDEVAALRFGPRQSKEAQARANEIVATWDEWTVAVEKARQASGLIDAEDALDRATAARKSAQRQLSEALGLA